MMRVEAPLTTEEIANSLTRNCYRYCYDFGYAEAKNGELMITKYSGTYL